MTRKLPPPCDTCPCPAYGADAVCKDVRADATTAAVPPAVSPPVSRAAVLREVADFVRDAYFRNGLSVQEIGTALRHMADEEQPAEVCGRTTSVSGTEYPPCGRRPGHPEAYCRSADGTAHFLAADTPCSEPNPCEDGELCGNHEREQAHAEGEHAFCGKECEVVMPSEQLRTAILCRAIPGAAGMLDELLRRAAATAPAGTEVTR